MKKIQSKMSANKLIVRFFRRSRAANSEVKGGIPPKFELIQAFIVVLVTCKNEKDPIKNKGSRVLTRFFPLYDYGIFFSNTQGQLNPQSEVESCRMSNSSKILWLSSIPARMKKIRSKMKMLECLQDYMSFFQTLKGS